MDELLFGVYYNKNTNLEHSLDFKVNEQTFDYIEKYGKQFYDELIKTIEYLLFIIQYDGMDRL